MFVRLSYVARGEHKTKPLGFICLDIFQLVRLTFDEKLKQLKLNILIPLLSEIYETRTITAVLLTVSKQFDVGMYWNIYELIS